MKVSVFAAMLLLSGTQAFCQAEDSIRLMADTTYVSDTTYIDEDYASEDSYDSGYASSTYTQRPGELDPTKKERSQAYAEKKFSKTAWKKIVGKTKYTEDPIDEKEVTRKPGPGRSMAWNPAVLKIVGYILILLMIGWIIYYLFRNAMNDDGFRKNSMHPDSLLYDKRHIDEIREDDIEKLLREALERNDFRMAVRIYYIRLLKHLHTAGFIAWKKDKTDHDYAAELTAFAFTREFRKLMTAYELIWYGDRTPTPDEFRKLQVNFNDFQRQAERPA